MITHSIFLTILFFTSLLCSPAGEHEVKTERISAADKRFVLGNEMLLGSNSNMVSGKNIGLITNNSGVLSNGMLFLDTISKVFQVKKVFTPEHGLRGDDRNEDYIDDITRVTVISLYGNKKKPAAGNIADVDVFVYDLQDVSARFYTFVNTMYYCMEAAVENNKEFVVCDRPVIPHGSYADGFMLEDSEESFVGMLKVPIAYGMTCGELAQYINSEYFNNSCRLSISKMQNYARDTDYSSLHLPWIKPSPNMYFPTSAVTYLGTCLLEGTNFAEGRGTEKPFEFIGAPYCDGKVLADELNSYSLAGVTFEPVTFTPQTITSPSHPPKFVGQQCEGVFINVKDKASFEPVKAGIAVLVSLKKLFPDFKLNKNNFIDKLAGTKELRLLLQQDADFKTIVDSYSSSLNEFKTKREKFLLY